jgi:AcrR family transcriptional regulator
MIISTRTQSPMPLPQTDIDLAGFAIPGVRPSLQKRSRATTAALLRAGAEMLRVRRLDEISIEALCAEVGATVGAFYSRFDSKDVYFNVLLELAARDGAAGLARMTELRGNASLAELCDTLVGEIVAWLRAHEGVVRAALQHTDTRPARWTRFKELGRLTSSGATPRLLRAMGPGRSAAKARAVGFGFQVVFGTLVNAILNDPGPLSINDDELTTRLSRCLLQQLEVEMAPASKPPSGPPGRSRRD